jgi:anaerobic selenocysteine-containing dehydrogenase
MSAMATHYRTCTLCEAMCGLVIETEGTAVRSIRGDEADPLSRGHICPKALALQDIQDDPDRVRGPLKRVGADWVPITWTEALDETARRLRDVQQAHGRDAVAAYMGNPSVHNYGSMLYGVQFLRALRTHAKFSATSVDQLPHQLVAYWMFGHQLLMPIPDVERTSFVLMLGGNPAASNGSIFTAGDINVKLKELRARGGKLVVIDPRKTETAHAADEHHFIRPGTDALFLLALLHVVFAEGLEKPGRLAGFTDGLAAVREETRGFEPERVAGATGIPADEIRRLARAFAAAPAAVAYGRVGVSTQAFGALCQWLVNLLNIVTGNFDRPGGAMLTSPAFDLANPAAGTRGSFARRVSRVRKLPEMGGELPVAVLAEEILTPGPGQIRALVTSAGNPVLSTPNGRKLDEALASLDFMVSVDFYINETTRHAHLILPPTAPLEHDHYDIAFHLLAVRNTAKFSEAVFPKPAGAKHDWEIFWELERRLAGGGLANRAKYAALKRVGPARIVDLGIRMGAYGAKLNPLGKGLTLAKVRANPHGLDLGPLVATLPGRLQTKGKRVQAAPEPLVRDLTRLRHELLLAPAAAGEFDLLLIGRRHLRSNNSWLHNASRLVKGPPRCTLLMHPADAAARGLAEGATAVLASRVGSIDVPVEVTDRVMPGVVCLPHGWGHDRPGVKLRVAQAHAGVSVNDVTDDMLVDALAGTSVLNGVPVKVTVA